MEGGDNVGGANNDVGVGGGASSGAAADPSTPSDGVAAAADGGGVIDNSSAVVEEGGNGLTATTQTVHSENGTPTGHGEDCQDCSWQQGQEVVDLASDARVQAFHQREKRDLLGLQTLVDELGFNERNDRHINL